MGFRLEMGKEVITKCLAGSWCRARPWREVENPVSLPSSLGRFATGDPAAGLVCTKCSQWHGLALWAVSLSTAAGGTPFGRGNTFV